MLNIDDRLIKEVSPKIGPNALSVLLAIAIHLNQKTNRAFPSHARLMELTGMGRDAVYAALSRLKSAEILKSEQQISSRQKTFGRRVFKVSTRFIKIFVDAEDVEPLPEFPYTAEPHTGFPDTANPETQQINKIEQINKGEQIKQVGNGADAPTPKPPASGENPSTLKAKTSTRKETARAAAPPVPEPLASSLEFMAAWTILLDCPKWKKKTTTALAASLKQLEKYPPEFAAGLIQNAIAGNYQGVVFGDTPDAFAKWQKARNPQAQQATEHSRPGPNYKNIPTYGQ